MTFSPGPSTRLQTCTGSTFAPARASRPVGRALQRLDDDCDGAIDNASPAVPATTASWASASAPAVAAPPTGRAPSATRPNLGDDRSLQRLDDDCDGVSTTARPAVGTDSGGAAGCGMARGPASAASWSARARLRLAGGLRRNRQQLQRFVDEDPLFCAAARPARATPATPDAAGPAYPALTGECKRARWSVGASAWLRGRQGPAKICQRPRRRLRRADRRGRPLAIGRHLLHGELHQPLQAAPTSPARSRSCAR